MKIREVFGMILLIFVLSSCQQDASNEVWILDCEADNEASCGFRDAQGELQIEYGKYPMIFTDSFKEYAIVVDQTSGIVGIDKAENILYQVFVYDNGPDYVKEGYFRIVKDGKIGFADAESGAIKIEAKYAAALPFQNGRAAICPECESKKDGEYTSWVNGKWGLIDKEGMVIVEPTADRLEDLDGYGQ
jgi:hypothetical protein